MLKELGRNNEKVIRISPSEGTPTTTTGDSPEPSTGESGNLNYNGQITHMIPSIPSIPPGVGEKELP